MSNDILISVVMPCYNSMGYLENTLKHVYAQTILPYEIIIVDDGSSDGTQAFLQREKEKFPAGFIKIFQQKNCGPGAARNVGIRNASGTWIAFLDSDDVWREQRIQRAIETIEQNPDAIMVSNDICEKYEDGSERELKLHERLSQDESVFVQLYKGNFLSTSSVCAKKEILQRVGAFNEELRSAQDYDLWLRLSREGSFIIIPEVFEEYAIHSGSISQNNKLRYECLLKIYKKYAHLLKRECSGRRAALLAERQIAIIHYSLFQNMLHRKKYWEAFKACLKWPMEAVKVLKDI